MFYYLQKKTLYIKFNEENICYYKVYNKNVMLHHGNMDESVFFVHKVDNGNFYTYNTYIYIYNYVYHIYYNLSIILNSLLYIVIDMDPESFILYI